MVFGRTGIFPLWGWVSSSVISLFFYVSLMLFWEMGKLLGWIALEPQSLLSNLFRTLCIIVLLTWMNLVPFSRAFQWKVDVIFIDLQAIFPSTLFFHKPLSHNFCFKWAYKSNHYNIHEKRPPCEKQSCFHMLKLLLQSHSMRPIKE